jgi:hypothetical protein
MLKKVLIAVAVVVVGFLGFVATRPAEFSIERSATMSAPPAVIAGLITDFHNWDQWSPWSKLDPAQKTDYSGAPSGTGAVFHWAGNDKVGEGRMTIENVEADKAVTIKLEFLKPWEATNKSVFAMAPAGSGTKVTWTMSGENNFMAKAMSVFMDMEKMVGPDFEKGLASMKTVAETAEKKRVEEAQKAAAAAQAAAAAAAAAAAQAAAAAAAAAAPPVAAHVKK